MMVSIAGILANILIAIIAFTIIKVLLVSGLINQIPESMLEPVVLFLDNMLTMNISLAVFNLSAFSSARRQQGPGNLSPSKYAAAL